jgi:hypothetical protein
LAHRLDDLHRFDAVAAPLFRVRVSYIYKALIRRRTTGWHTPVDLIGK